MCRAAERTELLLPMTASAAGAARDLARRVDCTHHPRELLDDALLLISELVTNAVLHGSPQLLLSIDCGPDVLRVTVRDGAAALPQRQHSTRDDESGRGLDLVQQLSHAWGVELVDDAHGTGKAVWFELRPS